MRKINTRSSNMDSFKYSILTSLHYYFLSSRKNIKTKTIENKYNFSHITPNEFEINNPNISLTVFDENNNII